MKRMILFAICGILIIPTLSYGKKLFEPRKNNEPKFGSEAASIRNQKQLKNQSTNSFGNTHVLPENLRTKPQDGFNPGFPIHKFPDF